jgi:hypothetical protein
MQTVDAKQRLLVLSPKLIDTKYYCTSTLVMKDKSKEPNLLKEGNKSTFTELFTFTSGLNGVQ